MQAHGDHWGCIDKDVRGLFDRWLPVIIERGRLLEPRERSSDGGSRPLVEGEAVGIVFPETALGALALVGFGRDEDGEPENQLLSAYPYAARGVRHRLVIEEIAVWENGLEAWITAGWDDGPSVTFFDTRYYANKHRYRIGETYEFVLAGLAYFLEVTRPEPIFITNPETIRAMRSSQPAEEGEGEAAIDLSPIEVRMEGAAILFPRKDLSPDDCEFQAPVKEIDTFRMDGRDVMRVRCTVQRTEEDIDIELYATGEALRGTRPRVGDDIRGMLWLQGHLVE